MLVDLAPGSPSACIVTDIGVFPAAAEAVARLKVFRSKRRWSQARLAAELGVHRRTVEEWEAGKNKPPAYLWLALSQLEATRHG